MVGKTIRMTADFSQKAWRPEGSGTCFSSIERKELSMRILSSVKIFFGNEGKNQDIQR